MASAPGRRRYERDGDGPEFGRAVAFSDGVFAIAMTLLVVTLDLPSSIANARVAHELHKMLPQFLSFFLSFAVIGYYWLAHHRMFSLFNAVTTRLLGWNLVYLCFVAFLPFPTALVGDHGGASASVMLYAATAMVISGLEIVVYLVALQDGVVARVPPPDVRRFGMVAALAPVLAFAISIPVALVDIRVAVACWLSVFVIEPVLHRWQPAGAEGYFQ